MCEFYEEWIEILKSRNGYWTVSRRSDSIPSADGLGRHFGVPWLNPLKTATPPVEGLRQVALRSKQSIASVSNTLVWFQLRIRIIRSIVTWPTESAGLLQTVYNSCTAYIYPRIHVDSVTAVEYTIAIVPITHKTTSPALTHGDRATPLK